MSRYEDRAPRRGRCDRCEEISNTTVTVDTASGVAAWTCPNCGHTQEPPRPTEADR